MNPHVFFTPFILFKILELILEISPFSHLGYTINSLSLSTKLQRDLEI